MENLTLFPLHNFRYKYAGLAILAISLFMLLLLKNNSSYFQIGAALGLYIFSFSKEKKETITIATKRYIAMKSTLGISLAIAIIFAFMAAFSVNFKAPNYSTFALGAL